MTDQEYINSLEFTTDELKDRIEKLELFIKLHLDGAVSAARRVPENMTYLDKFDLQLSFYGHPGAGEFIEARLVHG